MPRYIVKLDDWYLEWSTIVDAPVTEGMSLDDFRAHYLRQYGLQGESQLFERLERVEKNGTSALDETLDGILSCNRAGPDEAELTKDEIIKAYCLGEPIRDNWRPE
jgi:hypothetical protein